MSWFRLYKMVPLTKKPVANLLNVLFVIVGNPWWIFFILNILFDVEIPRFPILLSTGVLPKSSLHTL